jgi:hypothetical protein
VFKKFKQEQELDEDFYLLKSDTGPYIAKLWMISQRAQADDVV